MLTLGNPKTAKGESLGYLTGILHLAPVDVAIPGKSVCPWATVECSEPCLNTAGRGGIFAKGASTNVIQEARKRKTRAFFADRGAFLAELAADILRLSRKAYRMGLRPAVRLNGTSDLSWERFPVTIDGIEYRNIMAVFPDVQFYDYTKSPMRAVGNAIANYHLTFSRLSTNETAAIEMLTRGHANVAVAFDVLPETWRGFPVINGDASDLRFTDPKGVVVGLKAKGRARKETRGFVVRTGA